MANRGFENPCEVIVKDHEGLVYLAAKTVSAQSMSSKNKMEGRIQKLQYLYDGEFRDGGIDGRYVFFPVTALRFISMGKGRDTLLHGYAGDYSCFHHVHPLKQADSEEMKNFLEQFCNNAGLSVMIGV